MAGRVEPKETVASLAERVRALEERVQYDAESRRKLWKAHCGARDRLVYIRGADGRGPYGVSVHEAIGMIVDVLGIRIRCESRRAIARRRWRR